MKTIDRVKDFTPGIISNLYAVPLYNIQKVISNTIYINNTDDYFKFNTAGGRAIANYEPIPSENGDYYNVTISAFIPGESTELNKILNHLRKFRYIVIYQESDETWRWVGTPDIGLRMSITYNSGSNSNPNKGYNLQFTGQLLQHPDPSQPFIRIVRQDQSEEEIPLVSGGHITT